MDTIRPTRYPDLGYMEHGGIWRIVTTEDGAAVGPQYATKAELLADLDRYAAEYLGKPDPRDARIRELEGALARAVRFVEGYRAMHDGSAQDANPGARCACWHCHNSRGIGNSFGSTRPEDARRILAEGSVKA